MKGQRIYTDGGTIGGHPSKIGGVWAWCRVLNGEIVASGTDAFTNELPGYEKATNNQAELLAMVRAFQALPFDWFGAIYSDSEITIGRVSQGWKMNNIPPHMIRQLEAEQHRLKYFSQLRFHHVKGHPSKADLEQGIGDKFNVWCDETCRKTAEAYKEFLGIA